MTDVAPRLGAQAESLPTKRRWVAPAVAGALLLGIVLAFANAGVGLDGDGRLERVPAAPRPFEPFLGIDNWPTIFTGIFVVVAVIILGTFSWISWRDRSAHRALIVMVGVTLLSLLDPPANWVTYTTFDPQFLHFDTSWAWVKLAPLVEPLPNVPGYPMYFGMVGLSGAWLARKYLASERARGGWAGRHPLWTAFIIGFGIGVLWDVPTELFMVRADMYFYSEHWGPTITWDHVNWPILWGLFTWLPIACTTMLLVPDDRGRSLLLASMSRRVAERRGKGKLVSAGREVWLAFAVLAASYAFCMVLYGTLRVTGASQPSGQAWVYGESKVYDPYDHWKDKGLPGPYFGG